MTNRSELTDAPAQASSADCGLLSFDGMRSVCPLMHKVFGQLENLARSDAPVLIQGESGTGKQRAAQALHRASTRQARPLVTVVCTALSAERLDGLLCGPTGEHHQAVHSPLLKARAGTLVLRDLTALDLPAQGVLLRALQNEPSLDLNPRRAAQRVRLISTAAPDLVKRVKQGHFRSELYYRLVAAQVQIPPLRERPADLAMLAHEALQQAARAQGRPVPQLDPQAVQLLTGYSWPGNLRELFNVMGQALLRLRGRTELRPADLAGLLYAVAAPAQVEIPIGSKLADAERQIILQTLVAHGCIKHCTADTLGISRRTLYAKIAQYKKQGTYWLPHRGRRQQSDSLDHRPAQVPSPAGRSNQDRPAAPSQTAQGVTQEPGS